VFAFLALSAIAEFSSDGSILQKNLFQKETVKRRRFFDVQA
jgi:hypothetical protein